MRKETTIETEYKNVKLMRLKYQPVEDFAYKRAVHKGNIYINHYDYAVSVVDGTITIFYKGKKSSIQEKEDNILNELARKMWLNKRKTEIRRECVEIMYWLFKKSPGPRGFFYSQEC